MTNIETKICIWGKNCKAYETEAHTCNRETDKHRSEYCGSYRSLEKYGVDSRFYKVWRLKRDDTIRLQHT